MMASRSAEVGASNHLPGSQEETGNKAKRNSYPLPQLLAQLGSIAGFTFVTDGIY